jgi:endonuclease/exonuclease/phosphatase family metal-dependent hydrolase
MTTLTLVTFNCLGAPGLGAARRLLALARELNRRADAVVCLQEVQAHIYRRLLVGACIAYSAHAFEPFVHAPKGGLLTLARSPIEEVGFTLFRDRGLWYTPAVADWILHKGVLRIRQTCDGLPVIVLNTHLTANYLGDWRGDNLFTRNERAQLRQLAELVRSESPDALVLVAGDFNIPRGSWLYKEFIAESGLLDPLAGDTRPTVRLPRGLPARYAAPIDFALLRAPTPLRLHVASDLLFREKILVGERRWAYLSDHCGLELRLTWERHNMI